MLNHTVKTIKTKLFKIIITNNLGINDIIFRLQINIPFDSNITLALISFKEENLKASFCESNNVKRFIYNNGIFSNDRRISISYSNNKTKYTNIINYILKDFEEELCL